MSPSPGPAATTLDEKISDATRRYWRRNVLVMAVLLAVWAVAGLGCGVLFAGELNRFHLGGYPLGFWFAQQGSILVFVALILLYALIMNRLDAEHQLALDAIRKSSGRSAREVSP